MSVRDANVLVRVRYVQVKASSISLTNVSNLSEGRLFYNNAYLMGKAFL